MLRLGSGGGQPGKRLAAALLNSEIASPTSSSVGRLPAATTMMLEGSATGRFKGLVGVGKVLAGSTFAGKSSPRGGASAISLRTGNLMGFVWLVEMFSGDEALIGVMPAEPGRT